MDEVAPRKSGGEFLLYQAEDDGTIIGITQQNLEEWVMDTVFGRYVHPVIGYL